MKVYTKVVFCVFGVEVTLRVVPKYQVATIFEGEHRLFFDLFATQWAASRFAEKTAYANCLHFDRRVTCKVIRLKDDEVVDEFRGNSIRRVVVSRYR